MEPIILTIIGLSFLIWRNRIADAIHNANMKGYRAVLGNRADSFEPWMRKLNRWGIIFGGVVLLLAAYSLWFGPIEL
jgi:hypothetical protein